MYEIIGVFCGLAMVASAFINDINADSVSNNDFVQIETFEDYGGDIVPYVSDPYIEDNISDDVVEEIIVNQTVVDNLEVIDRMDKLDSKLTLLNNNFNSVLSSPRSGSLSLLSPLDKNDDGRTYRAWYPNLYNDSNGNVWYFYYYSSSEIYTYWYDVSDYDNILIDIPNFDSSYITIIYQNALPSDARIDSSYFLTGTNYALCYNGVSYSSMSFETHGFKYFAIAYNKDIPISLYGLSDVEMPDIPDSPSDPSGNDPSQPSINVTYPQEVIDDVNAMKKQLVTLTGVALLNLIIPMFVSVFKRMVDPFKKRRDD